jgi:hypothetical protein
MKAQTILANGLRTVRILWAALVVSTLLIPFAASRMEIDPKQTLQTSMAAILGLVALALTIASVVVPRLVLANGARVGTPEVSRPEPIPGVASPPGRFAQPDRAARRALAVCQQPFLLSMALSEAVSLIGLMLHAFGGGLLVAAPFFAAGTLLSLSRFPTFDGLFGPFERIVGASFAASQASGML